MALGVFAAITFLHQDPIWFGLAGLIIGLHLGNFIFQEPRKKTERKHIRLPKALRDSYYTDLVMKRIMEIYRPQQAQTLEDEEDDDEAKEPEEASDEDANDQYKWKD